MNAAITDQKKGVHWMVKMNRRNRTIHFILLAMCAGSHMLTQDSAMWKWVLLVLQFLAYPQILYFATKRLAPDRQRQVEVRNMFLDGVFFGIWAGLLGLPLWWTFTLYMGVSVNLIAFANINGWLKATLCMAAGIALAQFMDPAPLQAATTPLTTGLCMFTLGLYILSVGHDAYHRSTSLHRHRAQLQQQLEENHKLQAQLSEQATSDPLTSLYNRRHLNTELQAAFERCNRRASHLALMLIDVDYFKQINDQYGHAAGDEVLQVVAQQLRNSSRSSDMAFRYGGDEFLLVLNEISAEAALERARQICKTIASTTFKSQGSGFSISLSCGLALYPFHATNQEQLIHCADKALYVVKSQGRNGAALYETDLETLADEAK